MKHKHKYEMVDIGRKKSYLVYQCRDNCAHYVTPQQVIGKLAICWNCGEEFEVVRLHLKKVRLVCCTKEEGKSKRVDKEFIETAGQTPEAIADYFMEDN